MIKRLAPIMPLICTVLVLYSILFPSRESKTIVSMRRELDSLAAENATYRSNLVASVRYVRDLLEKYPQADVAGGVESSPARGFDSRPPAPPVPSGTYFVANGRSGFRSSGGYWLVGDDSPWGVVESVYRGGFVADGQRYCFLDRGLVNE